MAAMAARRTRDAARSIVDGTAARPLRDHDSASFFSPYFYW